MWILELLTMHGYVMQHAHAHAATNMHETTSTTRPGQPKGRARVSRAHWARNYIHGGHTILSGPPPRDT